MTPSQEGVCMHSSMSYFSRVHSCASSKMSTSRKCIGMRSPRCQLLKSIFACCMRTSQEWVHVHSKMWSSWERFCMCGACVRPLYFNKYMFKMSTSQKYVYVHSKMANFSRVQSHVCSKMSTSWKLCTLQDVNCLRTCLHVLCNLLESAHVCTTRCGLLERAFACTVHTKRVRGMHSLT
jgi:hypothetical protein